MLSPIPNPSNLFGNTIYKVLTKRGMNLLRQKIHKLIDNLNDEELERVWDLLYALHCDLYMMKAIEQVKNSQQPWNVLSHEEAVRQLLF